MNDGRGAAFDDIYGTDPNSWAFHDTPDPLVRYLRDRRLRVALSLLAPAIAPESPLWSALVTCGGAGGEGTWLADHGFGPVIVSDISRNALEICRRRDSRLGVMELDAQSMGLADDAYDLVLVQDGLHHLERPTAAFGEMLRVARRAVVVIEPYRGLVGQLFGKTWETQAGVANYVFRWRGWLVRDLTRSQLVGSSYTVRVVRLWDHNLMVARFARLGGAGRGGLRAARVTYAALAPFSWAGNMMVAIVVKTRPGG